MNKLLKILLGAFMFFGAIACEKEEPIEKIEYLSPSYVTMAGTWKLSQWNGNEQGDTPYFYIELDRRDHIFTIYQNIDSGKSRKITGTYEIITDEYGVSTIKGVYDHASGFWNHDYFVSELTVENMTWVASDDENDKSIYTRCDSIPEEIVLGTKTL